MTWSHSRYVFRSVSLVCIFGWQIGCQQARANEQVLKSFNSNTDHAETPSGGLIQGADGALYGVTFYSTLNLHGTAFKINPDGTGFGVLHFFGTSANDATNPIGPLVLGLDGVLYGVSGGGVAGVGALFKLNTNGTGYKELHSFGSITNDGSFPQAPLVQGIDGTLYGTTYGGGLSNLGTVFRLNPDGTGYSVLHSFGEDPDDGVNPKASVVLGSDGTLYGTTSLGGTNKSAIAAVGGTVFKLKSDGTGFALLHSFPDTPKDGTKPGAALLLNNNGVLYGTTTAGGTNNTGTVFRLNPDGAGYLVLYSFDNNPKGAPQAALVQGPDAGLYGTSGQFQAPGTAFRIQPDGTGFSLLHVFGSFLDDGMDPQGPLLIGTDGAFYGTTAYGGSNAQGTVFRMTAVAPPFVISIAPLTGGSFHIEFNGVAGVTYRLDVSTNLSNWDTLGTVLNESGPVQFLDANETKASQRFYRAVWLP